MFQNNITIKGKILIGSAVVILIVACAFIANRFVMAADLAPIINSAGANSTTVTLTPGTYTFSGNLTIPSNIRLHFERGAVIQIDSGSTLSINGPIDDCLYQIFDDKNTDLTKGVKFANGTTLDVKPEWWGARSNLDGSSDFTDGVANWDWMGITTKAINEAVNSHVDYRTRVIFSAGTYDIKDSIIMKGNTSLIGNGHSIITGAPRLSNGRGTIVDSAPLSPDQQSEISGIDLYPDCNATNPFDMIHLSHNSKWNIHDCRIITWCNDDQDQWALHADGINNIEVKNNFIMSRSIGGVYFGNLSAGTFSNNVVDNGHASVLAGVQLDNCTNCLIKNNIVYGGENWDDPNSTSWFPQHGYLITGGSNNTILNSRTDGVLYGIGINASNVTIKSFYMSDIGISGIYSLGKFDNIDIEDSLISVSQYQLQNQLTHGGAQGAGISVEGVANNVTIKNNNISPYWKLGAIKFTADPTFGDYPLIKNNEFVDFNKLDFSTLSSSPTPQVTISSNWQTNNTSPITLTDLTKAPANKEIFILFKDNNTTVKFSGSATKLKGNSNNDWKPTNGDHMRCTKQSTGYWNCIVGNDTGLAVSVETDTTPPTIANAQAIDITTTQATITWQTNENSTTQVEYGLTASYGLQTTIDTNLTSSHSVNLTNLTANTTYHFRVKSKDSSNNEAVSPDYTFTTLSANKPEDINQDGSVNTQDIQACVNQILNLQSWPRADVNQDGKFDVKDLQRIVNVILGV